MKQACFLFFLLLCGISALKAEDSTQKLLKILKLHQARIPFKAKFTQLKAVKEMGIELPSEGELEVKKMGNAVWKILKPAYLSVEISPEEIKIYNDPQGTPRIIKKTSGGGDMQGGDWMKLLMENPESVVSTFTITEPKVDRFHLLPKGKKQGFDWVELAFTKNADISEVFIQENSDDTLKINFTPKGK